MYSFHEFVSLSSYRGLILVSTELHLQTVPVKLELNKNPKNRSLMKRGKNLTCLPSDYQVMKLSEIFTKHSS